MCKKDLGVDKTKWKEHLDNCDGGENPEARNLVKAIREAMPEIKNILGTK